LRWSQYQDVETETTSLGKRPNSLIFSSYIIGFQEEWKLLPLQRLSYTNTLVYYDDIINRWSNRPHRMQCCYCDLMIPFAAYTAADPMFSMGWTTPKIDPSCGGYRPHLMHNSLGPSESAPHKRNPCDQHTDKQTDTQPTLCVTSVTTGRIYAMHAMRPKNTSN